MGELDATRIYCSPTERAPYASLGESSFLETESYGVDFAILNEVDQRLGIQRKKFPDDIRASLHDGRLARQVDLMRDLDYGVFVFEGRAFWNAGGFLVNDNGSKSWDTKVSKINGNFTKQVVDQIILGLGLEGYPVVWVDGPREFVEWVKLAAHWWGKPIHTMFNLKPITSDDKQDSLYRRRRARMIAALQVVPGVGPKAAKEIAKSHSLFIGGTEETLAATPGVGKKMVSEILKQFGPA